MTHLVLVQVLAVEADFLERIRLEALEEGFDIKVKWIQRNCLGQFSEMLSSREEILRQCMSKIMRLAMIFHRLIGILIKKNNKLNWK
jgi:hypothetical protein